jgi:OFA family oxalate/formate antiporter-like MFS transporter
MNFEKKRWQYLIVSMILALCAGTGYTWSVFQNPIMNEFNWDLQAVSLTFTIQILTSTLAPVVLGKYQKILGVTNYLRIGTLIYILGLIATRFTNSLIYLYIIYGFVVGLGVSILYPCLMAYSGRLFPEKTGMAAGFLACAYGGGSILWAPIAANLIEKSGVMSVFGYFAIIFAVIMIPFTFLIKDIPDDFKPSINTKKDTKNSSLNNKDYTWKEMLKTTQYYLIIIVMTLGTTAGLMIMGHASSILQEMQNFTPSKSAYIVGIISIFNTFGRLFFGFISDKLGRYNIMIFMFSVIGISMFILTKTNNSLFIIALLCISACYGGFASMFSPICADNFGIKHLALNYSFVYIAYGFAGTIGPQLAAWMKTLGKGYNTAFVTVAVLSLIGIILILILKANEKISKKDSLIN